MDKGNWQSILSFDAIEPLLQSNNQSVRLFAERDLVGRTQLDVASLSDLPMAKRITSRQSDDGSWPYPGGNRRLRSAENYNQIETFRQLGFLVEMFGFSNASPTIERAADYLFSFQTKDGDIRGILGNQYAPYYTAAMMELLIKAGYEDDPRVEKAFQWFSKIRQDDGGWAIPLRTQGKKLDIISSHASTLEPDTAKPSSSLVTGIVLRAYSVHPVYRQSDEARVAGQLLLNSLFKADSYPDRKAANYWLKFTFPFWFTDLISAMDSLSQLGFSKDDPRMQAAISWFINNQQPNGLWQLKLLKNLHNDSEYWLSLAICRILKRLYER